MKVLIKSHVKNADLSVFVLKEPRKQKEMMRLLTAREYARAIEYAESWGSRREDLRGEGGIMSPLVDLVLTPRSVHWDLINK